jgi:hypothetical protein
VIEFLYLQRAKFEVAAAVVYVELLFNTVIR